MRRNLKILLRILFIVAVIVGAFYLGTTVDDSEAVQKAVMEFGYLGIFILAVISGVNILVPIPVIAFLPVFIESGLEFITLIIVMSIGLTLGDLIGFYIGDTGKKVLEARRSSPKFLSWFEKLCKKNNAISILILFAFASLVPFPNETLVLPLALVGYKLRYIFPTILLGNIVFNLLYGLGVINIYSFF